MFVRALVVISVLATILGVVSAVPGRIGAIADDPDAIRHVCEVAMADARWQDPPFFARGRIGSGAVVVEVTGTILLLVCPVEGGTKSHIVAMAECPTDPIQPCTARRYR